MMTPTTQDATTDAVERGSVLMVVLVLMACSSLRATLTGGPSPCEAPFRCGAPFRAYRQWQVGSSWADLHWLGGGRRNDLVLSQDEVAAGGTGPDGRQ